MILRNHFKSNKFLSLKKNSGWVDRANHSNEVWYLTMINVVRIFMKRKLSRRVELSFVLKLIFCFKIEFFQGSVKLPRKSDVSKGRRLYKVLSICRYEMKLKPSAVEVCL